MKDRVRDPKGEAATTAEPLMADAKAPGSSPVRSARPPASEAGSRPRFKPVQCGKAWYVLDRAQSHHVVAKFNQDGALVGSPDKAAKAKASALNLKYGPWPV